MSGHTRLVYLIPSRLIAWKEEDSTRYCYMPICYICKRYIMYEIAVIRGGWRTKRKYICLLCAIRIYPKHFLNKLLAKHIEKLSKKSKIIHKYRYAKAMASNS
jgi:hypothetical protein